MHSVFPPRWIMKSTLVIINVGGKLQCIFNDFDVFVHQTKSADFRSESLCVVLNAFFTCHHLAYGGDF